MRWSGWESPTPLLTTCSATRGVSEHRCWGSHGVAATNARKRPKRDDSAGAARKRRDRPLNRWQQPGDRSRDQRGSAFVRARVRPAREKTTSILRYRVGGDRAIRRLCPRIGRQDCRSRRATLHPPAKSKGSKGHSGSAERVARRRNNGAGRRPESNAKAGGEGEKRAMEAQGRRQSRTGVAGGFALVAAQAARVRDALVGGRHLGSKKPPALTRRGERRSWRGRKPKGRGLAR